MKHVTLLLCVAMVGICAAVDGAQATNFAGVWTIDWTKTDAANAALGGPGEPHEGNGTITLTVTQDAKTLTVKEGIHAPRTYNLDGSESTFVVPGTDGQKTQVANASWDGARLKIVIPRPSGTTTNVWTLEHGDLQITTTGPTVKGVKPGSTALVFKKSS